MAASAPTATVVDFEDAGFDSPDIFRHDLLLTTLDHLLSKASDEIDRLHRCREANADAVDSALASAITGLDMLYISREATPISGTSIAHASWWDEKAPEPCDSETWLRAAIPEAQRSQSSFAMEQFLKAQSSKPSGVSRSMSRASSAHSHAGAGAGAGVLVSPSSRPGTGSKQQRNKSPQGALVPIISPAGKRGTKGPPSPDSIKSAENGLREELEIRRAHAAIARELEAKDAAEKEQLLVLQKQLKGRDYSYDHKGQVVVLNASDLAAVPDNSPAFRLASPELPLSPSRPGFNSGASASRKQPALTKGQGKERRGAAEYHESKSTSQPNALETMQPTLGVTLRQGNQSKAGPPQQRGSQGTNMTREEFERYMTNKAQQYGGAADSGLREGHHAANPRKTAAAPASSERSTPLRAAAGNPLTARPSAPSTPLASKQAASNTNNVLNKTNSRSGGGRLLAALPDAAPTYAGALGTTGTVGSSSKGQGQGQGRAPLSSSTRLLATPDINPSLTSAPDWGAPGNIPGYDVPAALPVVKPSSKLRELEVGRSDMLPRDRTNLATMSPPRTQPRAPRQGAPGR